MKVLTSQLPSGGVGYGFPSINITPLTFLELTKYLEGVPSDPLEKYLYDIDMLIKDDKNVMDCYIGDVDFLIFYKKLCTVSADQYYTINFKCPDCGHMIKHKFNYEKDVKFKGLDEKVMAGCKVELGGHIYDVKVPTLREFLSVFDLYLRMRKVEDLKLIKTISLFTGFDVNANQIERDILGATHSDITVLLALQDVYLDQVEPLHIPCPECDKDVPIEERRSKTVRVDSLIVDFFRDLCINCPISGSKILFKQAG